MFAVMRVNCLDHKAWKSDSYCSCAFLIIDTWRFPCITFFRQSLFIMHVCIQCRSGQLYVCRQPHVRRPQYTNILGFRSSGHGGGRPSAGCGALVGRLREEEREICDSERHGYKSKVSASALRSYLGGYVSTTPRGSTAITAIGRLTRHADGEIPRGRSVLCRVFALAEPVLQREDERRPAKVLVAGEDGGHWQCRRDGRAEVAWLVGLARGGLVRDDYMLRVKRSVFLR